MLARAFFRRQTPLIHRRTAVSTTNPSPNHIMQHNLPRAPQYPSSLLRRRAAADRALPTLAELNPNRIWIRTVPIFIVVITISALGIFNYQKVNSPVITANLYSLRTNPAVREILGNEVYFGNSYAWIHGSINLVSGKIDVWFSVKGTRQAGICTFKAHRYGGKSGFWRTVEWTLKPDGSQETLNLLDGAEDPLADAQF